MTLQQLSAAEALIGLAQRQFSAEDLVRSVLTRIERTNPSLRAFVAINPAALDTARAIDNARLRGEQLGPLAGLPIAVKDLLDTHDMPTAYGGLHVGRTHRPQADATVVRKLRMAGAVIVGKTNLHEYAFGTTTENPHFGVSANPWNRGKITGGSSGGSAAAIAAGLCFGAVGTDTGGSIRIPAALCGTVGYKPSFGMVSTAGVWPLAPSLDHVGPMTKTVEDAALLMQIMAGYDPSDPRSIRLPVRSKWPPRGPKPVRLGICRSFLWERCHPAVLQTVQAALAHLNTPAFEMVEVRIPHLEDVPEAQSNILSSEALSVHHAWLAERPGLYGDDVRARLEDAKRISGADYVRAIAFQEMFRGVMREVFGKVDVVVSPTTPLTATDIGQTKTHIGVQEIQIRSHLTRLTNPWNFSGLPAISLPCGLTSDGLPVGLQLVGPRNGDAKLLAIAAQVEAALPRWQALAPDYRADI
ncbi:MAG: amidase [Alicyclobacillus sp.]|nr:amidase [Alicyclobacillus sp.]